MSKKCQEILKKYTIKEKNYTINPSPIVAQDRPFDSDTI